MKANFKIEGIDHVKKTLKGLSDEALQANILQSLIRDSSKPISEKAAQLAGSRITGSSGLKSFLSNSKNIKYKALKKEFKKTGVVTGTIAPRAKKGAKKYGNIMHLFDIGANRIKKGSIKATNFMSDGLQLAWPDFEKRFKDRSLKILSRWAKRKGFTVR